MRTPCGPFYKIIFHQYYKVIFHYFIWPNLDEDASVTTFDFTAVINTNFEYANFAFTYT